MKKKYYDPQAEAHKLAVEDIVTASFDATLPGNEGEDVTGVVLPEDGFPEN